MPVDQATGSHDYLSPGFLSNLTEMSAADGDRSVPAGRSANRWLEKSNQKRAEWARIYSLQTQIHENFQFSGRSAD